MQVFSPSPDLHICALALTVTRPRLGKQRPECKQITTALSRPPGSYGYQNHSVTRSWAGHRGWLCLYAIEVCAAWRRLTKADGTPYEDSLLPWFVDVALGLPADEFEPPPWWGGDIHDQHVTLLGHKAGAVYVPEALTEMEETWLN